jgi:hypothetical protein
MRPKPRRSRFLRVTGGVSLLRYWGVSDAFALPPQVRFDLHEVEVADEPISRERVAGLNESARRPEDRASA